MLDSKTGKLRWKTKLERFHNEHSDYVAQQNFGGEFVAVRVGAEIRWLSIETGKELPIKQGWIQGYWNRRQQEFEFLADNKYVYQNQHGAIVCRSAETRESLWSIAPLVAEDAKPYTARFSRVGKWSNQNIDYADAFSWLVLNETEPRKVDSSSIEDSIDASRKHGEQLAKAVSSRNAWRSETEKRQPNEIPGLLVARPPPLKDGRNWNMVREAPTNACLLYTSPSPRD